MLTTKHTSNVSASRWHMQLFFILHPVVASLSILIVVILNLVAQRLLDWWPSFLSSELALSMLALTMPGVASYFNRKIASLQPLIERIVDAPSDDIATWFGKQLNFISGSQWAYVTSILLAITGSATMNVVGVPWFGITRVLFFLFAIILFAATGIVAWMYFSSVIFLYRLGNHNIQGAPFEWPEKDLRALNGSYLEIFAVGALLYLGAVIAVWVSPGGPFLARYSTFTQLWIFPFAALVIIYFLACQYYIHRVMVGSKQRRLDEFGRLLANTFKDWITNPSEDKAKIINDLMNWRDRVRTEPDWALDFKSMIGIVTGLLLPTIQTIIGLIS